ncbi:MAG: hypothetical protein JWR26_385 [Pedosphaera sp.]|nr:hypothetical protein [Pedosphaera sp.]
MKALDWIKMACEYFGGSREVPPPGLGLLSSLWLWRGLWWGILLTLITVFCGQTSKFIYIDF